MNTGMFQRILKILLVLTFLVGVIPTSRGLTIPTDIIETLYVPADGTIVKTNTILSSGQKYRLRITGSFIWGGCDINFCSDGSPDFIRWADGGGFLSDDHYQTQFKNNYIFLKINGYRVDIDHFEPSHMYEIGVTGSGSTISFQIMDGSYAYSDNSGALRIELVNEYVSVSQALGVKAYSQYSIPVLNAKWGGDQLGDPDTTTQADTICRWGCFLTSWAMMVDYYGFEINKPTNPRVLNNWLKDPDNDGYNHRSLIPSKVVEYANEYWRGTSKTLLPHRRIYGRNDQRLNELLTAGIPVILQIPMGNDNYHYVLAVGRTWAGGEETWYIHDPGYCGANIYSTPLTTLSVRYGNNYTRLDWAGPNTGPIELASITLMLGSPADLLVTDPLGRRQGYDPRDETYYDEIPEASYADEKLIDGGTDDGDDHPIKFLSIPLPASGDYDIQIIGTGVGTYTLEILSYNSIGNSMLQTFEGETSINQVDEIPLEYTNTRFIFLPIIAKHFPD